MSKKQTAIQWYISNLEKQIKLLQGGLNSHAGATAEIAVKAQQSVDTMNVIKSDLLELLATEQQNIEDAYKDACLEHAPHTHSDVDELASDYFTQNYETI